MKSSSIDQFVDGAEPDFVPISQYGGGSWYGCGESVGFGWFNCSGKSCGGSSGDFSLGGRGRGDGSGTSAGFGFGSGFGAGSGSGAASGNCAGG